MKRISALMATAMAGGCVASAALVRQHNPSSEFEAGAVTISASAPMQWENVVGELRPEFNSASARDYLDDVLPTVQHDVSARREATAVQFGADVSGETITRERTSTTSAEGQTTQTGTTTRNLRSPTPFRTSEGGQVMDGQIGGPGQDIFRGGDGPDASWPGADASPVDPILQYRAAVALHQELVLLDNYLDSAYDPCTQEAWLVRTRLVATPYARNQPLDVYARIYGSWKIGNEASWRYNDIRLVPLLVTDNFERSDSRRYEQLAAQIQGSLSGVQGIVAAGLGFNRYLNNLNAILGSQYNNLLTISQIEDNILTVRLGAAFSPTARYEMQSRSYDITFLVAIDQSESGDGREQIKLGFFANTEMRHAESGRLLRTIDNADRRDLIKRLTRWGSEHPSTLLNHVVSALETGLVTNDTWYDITDLALPQELESDLLRWHLAAYGSAAILPVSRGRLTLPAPQSGVFRDSLAEGLQARVVGPRGLNPNHVRAELLVSARTQADVTFAASSVAINPEGVIDAAFPSLGALGIDPDTRAVSLRLIRQCNRDEPQDHRDYPLLRDRAVLASAPVHAVSFSSEPVGSVTAITPSAGGNGEVRIRIRAIEDRNNPYIGGYEIHVSGGLIRAAAKLGEGAREVRVDAEANTIRVGREFGAYGLSLANLTEGTPVQVRVNAIGTHGGDIPGEESAVTFTVNAPTSNAASEPD